MRAGLTLGVLWQSNVSFHHKYDPAAQQAPGAKAMALPDLPYYVLGNFARSGAGAVCNGTGG